MTTVPLKLVTLIAEPILETRLTADLREMGASGYTVTDSRGEGSRGIRAGEVPGTGIRIETVVTEDVASRILDFVARHYFPSYAVIAFVATVDVVRGDKYI
jgi:nitrogen regulatory protein PII